MPGEGFNPDVVGAELADTPLPDKPDEQTSAFEKDLEKDARVEHQKELTADVRHYRELRKEYAAKAFWFMAAWCGGVAFVVTAQGFGAGCFQLPVAALTTLIGGTTISVVGLVGFILQGLFKKP